MPLIIETSIDEQWVELTQLIPGDPPGSLSDYNALMGRTILMFECLIDDSGSVIMRSLRGTDTDTRQRIRSVTIDPGQFRLEAQVGHGGEHLMSILTDRSLVQLPYRFRHITIDFGTRHCHYCGQDIRAQIFGQHIFEHDAAELAEAWPGGMTGVLECLAESLETSIRAARGFPRIISPLSANLAAVSELHSKTRRLR